MSHSFANVSLVTHVDSRERANPTEKVDLTEFFNAVVSSQKLELDGEDLEHMCRQNLDIPTDKLNQNLKNAVKDALFYYMMIWPGWQRSQDYYSGQLLHNEWFTKLHQYLNFKCNFVIKNADVIAADAKKDSKDAVTDTDPPSNGLQKSNSTLGLYIGAPPSVLNNIVFLEQNGNIVIKQKKDTPWSNVSLRALLNWPHVAIEVKLPDIGLTRINMHKSERFISLSGDAVTFPEIPGISHIKKSHQSVMDHEMKPFTYNFVWWYFNQLHRVLKEIPDVRTSRLMELQVISEQFLTDIKEVNVYNRSVCTRVSVGFHIGSCGYVRNTKMERESANQNIINYYETFLPNVNFTLHYLQALQDLTDHRGISFQSLNRLLLKIKDKSKHTEVEYYKKTINESAITYTCTLCKLRFSGPFALCTFMEHFQKYHSSEQAMLCYKCCHEFPVEKLAENRWWHLCSKR